MTSRDFRAVPSTNESNPSEEALLRFKRITKYYGNQRALTDVSLTVSAGRFVVLLGPSGSGKTTMLRCAAGIERVSEGSIELDGVVVDDGKRPVPPEKRDLAMVFQDYALWPHMTARQNVAYALRRRRVFSSEADQLARAMLGRVGLSALTERYPSELSGGEQQRVALARALVAQPRLLLFDEPLSNLDASLRDKMRVEIATLVREANGTALYITHDQSEAFALADYIGVLEKGRLVQFGTPEAIYAAPATSFVARLTGLAGELPGQVIVPVQDGAVTVVVSGVHLVARALNTASPGDGVRVLIRPSAVRLVAPSHDGYHLRGNVRDAAFCGRGYDHVVDLPNGHRLTGIFADKRWARGQNVGVQIDVSGCLIFPEDSTSGPTSGHEAKSQNGEAAHASRNQSGRADVTPSERVSSLR